MHAAESKPKRQTKKATPSSTKRDRATAYAKAVVTGKIVAGPHVRNACRRHLKDLEDGHLRGLSWDLDAAERVWAYFETRLKLSEGQFEGEPFLLDPSQAFIVGSLFGWKRLHPKHGIIRRFRRAYIEEGKGNGKSPLVGGIGLYGLASDGEAGAQIYAAGATRDQARVLFADAVKMVRQSPALLSRFRFSGGTGRENNIAHLDSGSFFRPVSRDTKRTGSGPRPHFALCDEIHEHPDGGTIETLERGFKFRRQPLLVMTTNSGSDRNSVCWEEHQQAVKVAAGTRTPGPDFAFVGEPIDDTAFSYVCALDVDDDPLNDPSCWIKANPLLGVILQPDDLQKSVDQAKAMPGKRNGILRLHFCVWTDADTAWIGRETLEKVLALFDPADHAGKRVFLGGDLSGHRDLTAIAHIVETGTVERPAPDGEGVVELPTYDAWIEAWTPGDNIKERSERDQAPYDVWADEAIAADEGRDPWLRAIPGERIRLDFVAAYLAEIDQAFEIALLAYDRYAWSKLQHEIDDLGLDIPQASHPQAAQRPAKPPQDMIDQAKLERREPPQGLWMPKSKLALEELILDQRIRLLANPVLISACMSAAVGADPMGNEFFSKAKATQRIDPLVSLAMAVGAAFMAPSDGGGPNLDDYLSSGLMHA